MTAAAIRVPFNVLRPGDDRAAIDAAVARVLDSGWFVLGPEVEAFETEFAAAVGAAHAVGVEHRHRRHRAGAAGARHRARATR